MALRLQLIAARIDMLQAVLAQDKTATAALTELVAASGSTLTELVGIAPRAAAEILIETGNIDTPAPCEIKQADNATPRHSRACVTFCLTGPVLSCR